MKKFYKITGILMGIVAVVGLILCIVGVALGAKGAITFSLDNGFRIVDKTDIWKYEDMDMEAFSSINIDSNVADIKIVKSTDNYGVSCRLNGQEEDFNVEVKDGTLYISDKSEDMTVTFNIFNFNIGDSDVITVYVPDDVVLENIKIDGNVGDIDIGGIQGAKELHITNDTGDVDIVGGTFETLDINTDVGDITAERVTVTKEMSVMSDVGDIELDGEFRCDGNIQSRVGDVDLNTSVSKEEYNYNLSASIGDIDVFGKEYDGSGAVENSTSAKYKLTITTDVGDIDVE